MVQQHRHSYQRVFNTCSVSNTSVSRLQKYHTDTFYQNAETSVNAAALNPQSRTNTPDPDLSMHFKYQTGKLDAGFVVVSTSLKGQKSRNSCSIQSSLTWIF